MKINSLSAIIGTLVLCSILIGAPNANNIVFERISIEQGLSQVSVLSITQDHQGFIWFGTMDGLNRYDGYSFKTYRNEPYNKTSISNNRINTLLIDQDSLLWIGTDNGLNLYNRNKDSFDVILHDHAEESSFANNSIYTLFQDHQENIWIGTKQGLSKYQKHLHMIHSIPLPFSKMQSRIISISEDKYNNLWVASQTEVFCLCYETQLWSRIAIKHNARNKQDFIISYLYTNQRDKKVISSNFGLFVYDQESIQFKKNLTRAHSSKDMASRQVTSILNDTRGIQWIGTTNGLYSSAKNFRNMQKFTNEPFNLNSISHNYIRSIYQDNSGVIWIGTDGAGINKYVPSKAKFNQLKKVPNAPYSLSDNLVYGIVEENENIIWVGTNLGLNRYDRRTGHITHYKHNPDNPNSLSHNRIRSLYIDKKRNLWVGTYKGLNRFDPVTQTFERIQFNNTSHQLNNEFKLIKIIEDDTGCLWLGTNGNGLIHFDPQNKTFQVFQHDSENPNSIRSNQTYDMLKGKDGFLWIATYGAGLAKFDLKTNTFSTFLHDSKNRYSIGSDFLYSLAEDENGNLWIGTYGQGLSYYNKKEGTFHHFTSKDGLPNNLIYGIEIDSKGFLWLSTNNGLSRFNSRAALQSEKQSLTVFRNYDKSDGLTSNEFNFGSHYKNDTGELFFGSVSGLTYFNPDSLEEDSTVPEIVITDFKIFNESVKPGPDSPLKRQITELDTITLHYSQNNFSFEFAALHYTNPDQNRYAFMLEGIDKNWIYTSAKRRHAYYTNLAGGKYVFNVKAANSDGLWNKKITRIHVHIVPPFWKTLWFRFILLLFISLLLMLFHRLRMIRIRKQNAILNRINIKLKKEMLKRKNADKAKDVLYKIAHANTSTKNQYEFYEVLIKELGKLIDVTNIFVALYNDSTDMLSLPFMKDQEGSHIEETPAKNTACSLIIENQNSILLKSEDISRLKDQGKIQILGAIPLNWLGVPLLIDDKVFGILVVQSYENEDAFTTKDMELLEFVSNQIAVSIQKKQAEEEIRRLSQSIEQSPVSLIITNIAMRFEYANKQFLRMNGVTIDEIRNMSIADLISSQAEPEQEKILETLRSGKGWTGELSFKNKDGAILWEVVSISPVKNENDTLTNYIILKENVTEIKMLQQQLNQTQKMDSIGTLAGGIAHDFNNLLTVINGHSEIALLKLHKSKPVEQDLESILKAGKKAEALTRQLLAFSRKQIYNAKVININGIIEDMSAMLHRLIGEDILMKIDAMKQPVKIQADSGQIEQILMNLVINARDAIHENYKSELPNQIIIETSSVLINEPISAYNARISVGNYAVISISDTGKGMLPEVREKIFDPFFTTKGTGKGTGLGMATVYGVIQQNRGYIDVYSEPEKGTIIKIYWPSTDKAIAEVERTNNQNTLLQGSGTLLLVEDDDSVRQFAAQALNSFGYEVIEAEDGQRALELIERGDNKIDLLITDVVMPNMNGRELGEKITDMHPDIKILYASGYSDKHISSSGSLEEGINFIQKPYSVNGLLTKIKKIVGSNRLNSVL